MRFENQATIHAPSAPVDWSAVKTEIIARLDVAAEFERLGVEFSKPAANSKGVRECHAIGRKDEIPSAFVNVKTGVYHDSGGEGESLHLFDFALKHGSHGRWIDVVKHYADRAGVDVGNPHAGKNGRIKEAQYLYKDAEGVVRYAVFRYRFPNGKKTFSQHPPDGKGGWSYGEGCMDGVEPLPYRLPDILAGAELDDPIWIVEGEKDADRLAAENFTATTNHQGAQSTDSTWPKFLEHFRNRECYVIPDNDSGGRKHAHKVAAYLKPVARLVKVVSLPSLPPKGDVSDWLDLGNDVFDLGQLANAAPAWAPDDSAEMESECEEPIRDATAADIRILLAGDRWIWPLWIPNGELTLLAAEGGTGKTRFCFDLVRRIYHGLPWPDGSPMTLPRDSKTLWIAADNQWQEIVTIPASFGIPDELIVLNAMSDDPFGGTSLQTPEELEDLEARIRRIKPVLVFIDTITNTSDYKAQDAAESKRQYKPLQEIASRCQTGLMCSTHLNASGKVLGRRAVEKVRVVQQLDYPDPDGQPNRRKLWVSKSKALRPEPLGVTMGEYGNEYDATPPLPPETTVRHNGARSGPPPTKTAACMAWLSAYLATGPARVLDIRREAEASDYSAPVLYRARDLLHVVEYEEGPRNHKFWTIQPQVAPQQPFEDHRPF